MPLVATCTTREVALVDLLGTRVDVREGTILTREGRPGMECFVVLDGTAEVRRGGETLELIGPGSVLGEMALLHGTARTATVIAATPMRLLVFTRNEFEQLSRIAPSIEAGLRRIAADRRAANSVASFAYDSRFATSFVGSR